MVTATFELHVAKFSKNIIYFWDLHDFETQAVETGNTCTGIWCAFRESRCTYIIVPRVSIGWRVRSYRFRIVTPSAITTSSNKPSNQIWVYFHFLPIVVFLSSLFFKQLFICRGVKLRARSCVLSIRSASVVLSRDARSGIQLQEPEIVQRSNDKTCQRLQISPASTSWESQIASRDGRRLLPLVD